MNQKNSYQKKDYQKKDFSKHPFKKKLFSRHDFYIEGCPEGVKVPDSSSYSLERALKYLKRQLKDSDKVATYRAKREYIKPCQVKRIKMDEAKRSNAYKVKTDRRNEKGYIWVAIVGGTAQ